MTDAEKIDYLIVGQGLAGSLLAWELIRRGADIVILDQGKNNASRVAAGLINPVTGQRFAKSENIDALLPLAKSYYGQLSDSFKQRFYIEKSMLRLFRNEHDHEQCLKRLVDTGYQLFLGEVSESEKQIECVETPFGYLEQKQTGYLLTQSLLTSLRNFFITKRCYRQVYFDYGEIQFQPRLKWRDLCPRRIIFCEGYRSIHNPWFGALPMQPVKGEILTLAHSLPLPDKIINFGHWLVPLTDHTIRIGATFDRNNMTGGITEAGKSELLFAAKSVVPKIDRARLIDHQAGIRPCTSDRQPFIGIHPQYRQLAIFNGFGAKGSVLIPGCCLQFADFLLQQTPLPVHCNIQRYYETHFAA